MFRSFRRYKYKTLLIIISATAAIVSIFLITSLSQGIIRMYADMLKTDGDIIITQKGVADTFFSDVNRSLLAPISHIPGVRDVYGIIVGAGAIGSVPIAGIYGVTKNRYHTYHLSSGNYPKKNGEVMIGKNIDLLLHHPKKITLLGTPFIVSGVYKSDIGFENGGVVIPITDAQKLFHKDASFLLVSVRDITGGTKKIIYRIIALDPDITVKSTNDFIANYNQFKIIRISGGVIASISFFMGFLAIVSLMSMMIYDRAYEFGIKRALGISKLRIVAEVVTEVVLLTLFSFIIAYLLSLSILDILEHVKKFQGYLSGEIDLTLFLQLLGGSLMMAVIGALIPALLAARVDPLILINRGQ